MHDLHEIDQAGRRPRKSAWSWVRAGWYTRPLPLPLLTRESGGVVVEVNPESTPLTAIAVSSIRGRAGQILPRLLTVESEPSWNRVVD